MNSLSLAKQLYIPGKYFSLMNYSKNLEPLEKYLDIYIDFSLTQVIKIDIQTAIADQGNSIYDFIAFNRELYPIIEPCYSQNVVYLTQLYD